MELFGVVRLKILLLGEVSLFLIGKRKIHVRRFSNRNITINFLIPRKRN